ncbi:MAG: hypothetical protein MUE79_05395 [Nitratireductor sp.]|jgi:hypothetical protein|nr:hypothetical protein [Nitratireductor sp.]
MTKSAGGGTPTVSSPAIATPRTIRTWPRAIRKALDEVPGTDRFFDAVNRAAENAGCKMLFEIPAMLLRGEGDRAAAISCGGEQDIIFIVFDSRNGEIVVISAGEAPETVLDFTRSYAGVLGMIASDRKVTAPLLQ